MLDSKYTFSTMPHPIFALILCGNIIEVATLIRHDPEAVRVKHSDSKWINFTPLIYASKKGRVKICKLLLDNGASVHDVSDFKDTALHFSCGHGHLEVAKLLLEHGASLLSLTTKKQTPLHMAAQYGYDGVLSWILDNYPFDINMTDYRGNTLLHMAALGGYSDCCSVILQHQPDVNKKNDIDASPLDHACQTGDMATARLLLQHGAEVSRSLHKAAERNHANIIEMMVNEFDFEVNIVSSNCNGIFKFKYYRCIFR